MCTKPFTLTYSVHPVNHKRTTEGAWETVAFIWIAISAAFYKYILCMAAECFDDLLGYVRMAHTKNETIFRKLYV